MTHLPTLNDYLKGFLPEKKELHTYLRLLNKLIC